MQHSSVDGGQFRYWRKKKTPAYVQAHVWQAKFWEELGVGVDVVEYVLVCHTACV